MRTERFLDQIVLVTGGARGIGKTILKAFARERAKAVFCDVNKKESQKTRDEIRSLGFDADFLLCDLSKKGASAKLIQKVVHDYGRLDILVNNARSRQSMPFLQETEDSWDAGIAVDLKAAFFLSQEAVRQMSGQPDGGCIVNISSISAELVCHQSPVYHIAKAGIEQMTRYFAVTAGERGVRVNSVSPGFIVQEEHQDRYAGEANKEYRKMSNFSQPLGRVGSASEVADAVLFLCSSEASFISGQSLCVDGAATLQEQSTLIFKYDRQVKSFGRKVVKPRRPRK